MKDTFEIGDKVVLKEMYRGITGWLDADAVYTVIKVEKATASGSSLIYTDSDVGTYEYKLELYKPKEVLTLKEQIEVAKSLIGKRIKSRVSNTYGTVQKFDIFSGVDEFVNKATANFTLVKDAFDYQSVVVVLQGGWEDGIKMVYPISIHKEDIPKIENSVTINGYESVDNGDYVEFGCARISKISLRYAQQFMENYEVYNTESNKNLTSIKIGNGEFTLKDINTLLS